MNDMKRNKQKSKSLTEASKNAQSQASFTLEPLSPARDDYDYQNAITGITREELEQMYAMESRRNSSGVLHGIAGLATESLESYTPRSFLDRLQEQNANEAV